MSQTQVRAPNGSIITLAAAQARHESRQRRQHGHDNSSCACCCLTCDYELIEEGSES